MNSHYTYLVLDIASVLFPLALSFDKKVAFYKLWKYLFPAMVISGAFFILWDVLFTAQGVWGFNPKYITGINVFNLPIEEVLFFVCVPYSCVFIYEVFNAYVKRDVLGTCGKRISILISIISLIACILFYNKTYTIVNAGTGSITLTASSISTTRAPKPLIVGVNIPSGTTSITVKMWGGGGGGGIYLTQNPVNGSPICLKISRFICSNIIVINPCNISTIT